MEYVEMYTIFLTEEHQDENKVINNNVTIVSNKGKEEI